MSNVNNMDEQFNKAFEGLEIEPSEHVWSGIEAQLLKKKSRKAGWIPLAAAASAVIAIGIAGLFMLNDQSVNPELVSNQLLNSKNISVDQQTTEEIVIDNAQSIPESRKLHQFVKREELPVENMPVANNQSPKETFNSVESISVVKNEPEESPVMKAAESTLADNSDFEEKESSTNLSVSEKILEAKIKTYIESNVQVENSVKIVASQTIVPDSVIDDIRSGEVFAKGIEEKKEEEQKERDDWFLSGSFSPDFAMGSNSFNLLASNINIDRAFLEDAYTKNQDDPISGWTGTSGDGSTQGTMYASTGIVTQFITLDNNFSPSSSVGPAIQTLGATEISEAPFSSFNFRTGAWAGLVLSKRWSMQTGVLYRINAGYRFIDIPFAGGFNIINKRFKLAVLAGPSINLFTGNIAGLSSVLKPSVLNFSAESGISLSYGISKLININLQPMFRYSVHPLNRTNLPHAVHMSSGVTFKF